ncbi:helix-turn-helix domain-containing protein [Serratia sp. 14-2641]|uniref:helix-turn-helix domain-containing protein n=1 Tax=Serratia sp. 14-2641 TaxID=1841657 RepID=UPI0013015EAD|nr:helix-turn-helix domain-containing protein [Serratia sp. 14-2641]
MDNYDKNGLTSKPVAHIQALIDSLLPLTLFPVRKGKPGQSFQFLLQDKRMCFLLVRGECVIKRNSDSLILHAMIAPGITGLSNFTPAPAHLKVQATTAIEYIYLSLDEFYRHVDDHDLWKAVAYSLMHVNSRFNEYMKSTTAIPNYELICNLLTALSEESFETRATVSAVQYILDRTSLSRSGVMKTLAALNAGGYIVIKRGLLIKMNKLPEKF